MDGAVLFSQTSYFPAQIGHFCLQQAKPILNKNTKAFLHFWRIIFFQPLNEPVKFGTALFPRIWIL